MDILSTILDFSKYDVSGVEHMLKKQFDNYHVDNEIYKLKDQNLFDEYIKWLNEASLLDVRYEEGYGTTTLLGNISNEGKPVDIKFCYYKLQNNNFLYYLRFINDIEYESDDEYEEMIVLLNLDGKYICIGEETGHFFIHTDKFLYGESDGSISPLFDYDTNIAVFDYDTNIADLEKETLFKVAIDLYNLGVNLHWLNENR